MSDDKSEIIEIKQQINKLNDAIAQLRGDPNGEEEVDLLVNEAKKKNSSSSNHLLKPKHCLQGHFGKIYALQWGPAELQTILTAAQDGKLLIWDAFAATKQKRFGVSLKSAWVLGCAYSPSGEFVASGGLDNICTIYKVDTSMATTSKPAAELSQHDGYISSARFINDNRIVTSSGDGTCILWDIGTQSAIQTFQGHSGDVMSIALYGENALVSGSVDMTCALWDIRVENRQKLFTGHESDVNSVAFFPDGNAFVSGADDSTCRLFDIRAYRQIQRFGHETLLDGITSVDISKSGRYIFAGTDRNKLCMWDILTGNDVSNIYNTARVSAVGVSRDGYALAASSWDCTTNIFY